MADNEITKETDSTQSSHIQKSKPWYKKKRIMIPLVLVIFITLSAMGSNNADNPTTNRQDAVNTQDFDNVDSATSDQDNAPKLTPSQENAVRSARSYISFSGFSRQGLINQLSSEYGDKYSVEDATVAVDSLNIDYNEQAKRSAESYLQMSGFSCQGLIDQLSSDAGDKYTVEQAQAGAKAAGAC